MKEELTPVSMKLSSKTLDTVKRLQEKTGEQNRTKLVANSLEVFEELVHQVGKGARIVLEQPNGKKEVIRFIGIKNDRERER